MASGRTHTRYKGAIQPPGPYGLPPTPLTRRRRARRPTWPSWASYEAAFEARLYSTSLPAHGLVVDGASAAPARGGRDGRWSVRDKKKLGAAHIPEEC